MTFIPAIHPLEVFLPGEPVKDRFGNERPGPGEWVSVLVAQWWVHKTEESAGDSLLRTVDQLTAHFPVGEAPPPDAKIRTPDGSEWQVEGNPENYEHGFHGWSPGLVVVHAKKAVG